MSFTKILTDRLLIRTHSPRDWQDLFEYLSLRRTYDFEPGTPITKEEAMRMANDRSSGEDFLPVVLRENDKMIGHLYFRQTEPREFLSWELGYIFNPAYHNMGYATEASRAILDYGFDELKAHRIVAYCDPRNVASWRVLEKIGMEREGYFRQKAFFKRDADGKPLWHDCCVYGILEKR